MEEYTAQDFFTDFVSRTPLAPSDLVAQFNGYTTEPEVISSVAYNSNDPWFVQVVKFAEYRLTK